MAHVKQKKLQNRTEPCKCNRHASIAARGELGLIKLKLT